MCATIVIEECPQKCLIGLEITGVGPLRIVFPYQVSFSSPGMMEHQRAALHLKLVAQTIYDHFNSPKNTILELKKCTG